MPSSVQIFSQTIADFKRLQGLIFEKQSQIGADTKASTFAELGNDVNLVQGFKLSAERANRFISSISEASRRNDSYSLALQQLIDAASQFKQSLTIENSGATQNINDLQSSANNALDLIGASLNSKDGSNFIFSGSKTNVEPVDDLKLDNNYIDGGATATYYNGDDFKQSVDVSTSQQVEYGITAADPAFQKLIAAINIAKSEEGTTANYNQAGEMLDEAISDLIALQAGTGDKGKIFDQNTSYHQVAKDTFENKYAEINSPDIIQLTIESSQLQATLQASFITFSKISNLSLTNYL